MNSYYNVEFNFQRPLCRIKLLEDRVFNAIVETMNNQEKLPKYLLVILDKDLIESLTTLDFGVKISMERILTWLIEELDKTFYWRKENIRSKKPGALTGPGEPRLIFTSILDRPHNTDPRKHEIYRLVTKANGVLESVVRRHNRYCHLMYITSINEFLHYDYQGNLTPQGRVQFWKEVDEKMKNFDKGRIDLKPKEFSFPMPRRSIKFSPKRK